MLEVGLWKWEVCRVPDRPLLIYDGDCRFCCRCIEAAKVMTGERVRYEPSQTAASAWPDISTEDFSKSVQWIGADGSRASGAEAIFRALAATGWAGRILLDAYQTSPLFARTSETMYGVVARNRETASLFIRVLWGNDLRPPTYSMAGWWFLRILGAIYLLAFISYAVQARGLNGVNGILPAAEFFQRAGATFGPDAFWNFPSLCWLGAGNWALLGWSIAGMLAAFLLLIGIAPLPCLIFLWADYLSLSVSGQIFYQYQWDILLLETGFLAIFLAPRTMGWSRPGNPPALSRLLLVWLLFRLMFASGVVKLSSGDPTWANGTALSFHYFTQPLPTPLAWFMQQLSPGFQWWSVQGMLAVEVVFPFLLFGPRHVRLLGAAGIAGLQIVIALTGNYGFFNLLTLALCLLAVDDRIFPGRKCQASPVRFLPRFIVIPAASILFALSLIPLGSCFRQPISWPAALLELYDDLIPFRTINSYGLFAVMTTERKEIIVQGSDDGVVWKTYSFRYKPGDTHRAPPWVAPYMPRLDWQMWFAALGSVENNPWFIQFLGRLARNSPDVVALLEDNPFPDKPPRYLRALTDRYTFTARPATAWWNAEPAAVYCPELSLRDLR